MTTTMRRSRRPRSRTAAAGVIAVLAVLLVTIDNGISGAATPPAELVSVIPAPDFGDSMGASISADGGFVAFDFHDFIFEGNIPLGKVRDRAAQQTDGVPFVVPTGNDQHGVVLSRDGCQVAYLSSIFDSIEGVKTGDVVVAADRCAGTPAVQIYPPPSQSPVLLSNAAISAHGRYVAFNDLSNNTVVRLDRDADEDGTFENTDVEVVISVSPASSPSLGDEDVTAQVAISATNTGDRSPQIYLWDPSSGPSAMTLVSANDGTTTPIASAASVMPSMTPDGRYVAFVTSNITNSTVSVIPTAQVLVRDVATNRTAVVSRTASGTPGRGLSITPSISADGTQIAFGTTAADLLAPPVGGLFNSDVTSLDLLVARSAAEFYGTVVFDRVSLKPNGDAIDPRITPLDMRLPVISSNGRWVAFESRFNAELQTGGSSNSQPIDTDKNIYVIGRPTSVTVSPLDFGAVQVASTSAAQLATVSNTGISSFLPDSISAGGEFSVVGGGTCAVNTFLSPGRSCTVAVQFKPAAAGNRSGTLTIAETGFAPIKATGGLSGRGVPATVVTDPTTTAPAPTTTAPKTTTTAALTITPNPGSFGSVTVGISSPPLEFVVTSVGTRSAPVNETSITGTNASDYTIVSNNCTGANLPPGAGCDITVVFTPTDAGPRTAVLAAGSPAATASATIGGTGALEPTLRLLPNVVELGEVTVAVGAGFPANLPIQVQWVGDTTLFNGTTDSSGNVLIQIPVRPDELPGPRILTAVDQPSVFTGVTTPGLVVDPSMHPPTTRNPALPNVPSLIVRG